MLSSINASSKLEVMFAIVLFTYIYLNFTLRMGPIETLISQN